MELSVGHGLHRRADRHPHPLPGRLPVEDKSPRKAMNEQLERRRLLTLKDLLPAVGETL